VFGTNNGSPADVAVGLKRHAKLWTVMGWSTDFFREGRHKALGFDSMQTFVDTFMTGYFAPMDPNDLLAMAWKLQQGDVSRNTGGDLASALGRIKAKIYVMPISHDVFFPPDDCEVEQRLIPGSQFSPLKSICGHLGLPTSPISSDKRNKNVHRGNATRVSLKTTLRAYRTAPAHGELPIWSASKRMLGSGTRAAPGVPHIETREAWLNPGFASGVPFFEGTSPLHRSRARRTSTT
jgi:hypothetical protein